MKLLLLAAICVLVAFQADPADFQGLSGADLADAVRARYAPPAVPSALPVEGVFPDDWPGGWWPAPWPASGTRIGLIVPPSWTKSTGPLYDLYNLIATDDIFEIARQGFPPGQVDTPTGSGPGWTVGTGIISGAESSVWMPAPDRRGDLARRIMYIALIYRRPLWNGLAFNIMADGSWPLLTSYAVDLLGRWALADPVDSREYAESASIARLQGNENPFIAIPGLFDYLWGRLAGQPFMPEPSGGENPSGDGSESSATAPAPLKGTYSRLADRFIHLTSPYVPSGARWSLDGEPVESPVDLAQVPLGPHILYYTHPSSRGKLKIQVTP